MDALLCRDDLAAIGGLRALRLAGLDVPRDVAVIGWDAIELTASTVPSLTSVAADTDALVSATLDLVLDPAAAGRRRTVDFRIVFRESAPG